MVKDILTKEDALKLLDKEELLNLKKILSIIEDVLFAKTPPYLDNFFLMEYFNSLDRLSVIRVLTKLDKEFNNKLSPQQADGVFTP